MNNRMAGARFSGWRVVAVLSFAQMCGVGLLQIYSLLVDPLQAEFGISAAAAGAGMSVFVLVLTGVGPILGPWVDRGHVRRVMLAGVVLMVLGIVWMSLAPTAMAMLPAMALTSVGVAMFGPIPANTCVMHWFYARRGTAIALVGAGGAVAGFGLPPLAAWLIQAWDWRVALQVIGVGAGLLALPMIAFGLIANPAAVGQQVDGRNDPPPAPGAPVPVGSSQSVRLWLATPDFWLLAIGMALVLAVPIGMGPYLVPYLAEQGIEPQRAALAVSVAAVFGFVGTLAGGMLADRAPPKAVFLGLVLVMGGAYLVLGLMPGFTTALFAAAALGIGAGGVGPFMPLFAGMRFGADVIGRVMGVQGLIALPLLSAAPILAGAAHGVTGNYQAAFTGAALSLALPIVLILLFRVHRPVAAEPGPVHPPQPLGSTP